MPPLRVLLDPVAALRDAVSSVTGKGVSAVILFGSIARGEASPGSDIDLAVIARPGWDKRVDLEDSVRTRLGNECDVLAFTEAEFDRLATRPEAAGSEKHLRELTAAKGDVEYGTNLITTSRAAPLVRRARTLVLPKRGSG